MLWVLVNDGTIHYNVPHTQASSAWQRRKDVPLSEARLARLAIRGPEGWHRKAWAGWQPGAHISGSVSGSGWGSGAWAAIEDYKRNETAAVATHQAYLRRPTHRPDFAPAAMARSVPALCDKEDRDARRSRSPEVRQNPCGSSGLPGQRRGNTAARPTSSIEDRSHTKERRGETVRCSREGSEPGRGRRPKGRSAGPSARVVKSRTDKRGDRSNPPSPHRRKKRASKWDISSSSRSPAVSRGNVWTDLEV